MAKVSARKIVLAKYPQAFGWREFSVSDYTIRSGTGKTLASAFYAKDAWEKAAKKLRRVDRERHD